MPTYIMLTSLTAQGVQTLKANPDRLREVNRDVEELGAKVVHQWATLGPFDFVNMVEAPDAETIARVSVALGARGSAKLQTLTALSIDEFLGVASTSSGDRDLRREARVGDDQLAVHLERAPVAALVQEREHERRHALAGDALRRPRRRAPPGSAARRPRRRRGRARAAAPRRRAPSALRPCGPPPRRVDAGRDRRAAAGAVEERQLVVR